MMTMLTTKMKMTAKWTTKTMMTAMTIRSNDRLSSLLANYVSRRLFPRTSFVSILLLRRHFYLLARQLGGRPENCSHRDSNVSSDLSLPVFLPYSPNSHHFYSPSLPSWSPIPALSQSNQENKWRQPCTSSLYSVSQQRKKKEDGAGNLIRSEATLPPGNSKST